MTSIEKSTMRTSTVAIVIVTIVSSLITGLTTYFSSVNGTKEGFNQLRYEMNIKINNLENEDKLLHRDITELKVQSDRIERTSYRPAASFQNNRK